MFALAQVVDPKVWLEVFDETVFFEDNQIEHQEKERIRQIVKGFEYAAKRHGQMQAAAALGDVQESAAYESGKALKTAREELYKELGV